MEGKKLFCTQCGKQIESSEKFCSACGKPVNKEAISVNDRQINAKKPNTIQENIKQKKANKKPVIPIIAVLVAALCFYSLFSNTEFKEIAGNWTALDTDYPGSMQLEIKKNGNAKLNILISEEYDLFFNEGKATMDFQLEKNQNEFETYQLKELGKLDIIVDRKMFEFSEYDITNSFVEKGLQGFEINKRGNEVILSFENLDDISDLLGSETSFFLEKISENELYFGGLEFYR